MLKPRDIVERAFDLLNRISFLDRRNTFDAATGARLHSSEIHAVLAIARDPSTNATQLAEQLGVTKGAISQTLARLQQKEVVRTEKIPQTKNELRIVFTPHGRRIVENLQQWVEQRHASLFDFLGELQEGELETIDRFLAAVEDVVEE